MKEGWIAACMLLLASMACGQAAAEEPVGADEALLMDGRSGMDFPAGVGLSLAPPATLEFWVAATWEQPPDFDPCVLSLEGDDGVLWAVHVQADRQTLGLYTPQGFASVPVRLDDGRLHSVTLAAYSEQLTEFIVDGESVGFIPVGPSGQPGEVFHIGSLDGEQAPFKGVLARLRLWEGTPDEAETPPSLTAQSTVNGGSFALEVYGEPDADAELAAAAEAMGAVDDDLPLINLDADPVTADNNEETVQ
ncbi:MAG: hypothetical protein H6994_11750 [Pseudomonadales bacterium]|nr:hypothetical protein [Pseudomonadales bacterium]